MKEQKKFTALTEILARQLLNPSAGVLVSFSLKWLIDLKYELSQTESEQPIMKLQMSHRKSVSSKATPIQINRNVYGYKQHRTHFKGKYKKSGNKKWQNICNFDNYTALKY